jgi:hypothetical protein
MKPKFFLAAGVVLMLAFVLVLGTAAAQPANPCDPAYVVRTGKVLRVSPTEVDDTANIQCAFDWANDIGPGMTVRLLPGTFHTAQILVVDFHGAFQGSGRDHTTIVNLPDLPVIPDIETIPPSPDNPWPNLFIFIDSDVTLSNMAIHIFGENPVGPWSVGDFGPVNQFGAAIIVSGTESHFNVSHISLEGEQSSTSPVGYNVFNGIYFEGYITPTAVDFLPLSGSFHVTGSIFKSIGWPTDFINVTNAKLTFSHNTYKDVIEGIEGADMTNSSVVVHNNRIETNEWGTGILFLNYLIPQDIGASYVIRNNVIKAPIGIAMYQTMDDASTCLIKTNKLQWVTDTPIFLGPGAQACVLKNNRE